MDLNEYQRRANETDQRPGEEESALMFPLMGLASEVGSLITQFKKRVRDGDAHELFSERAGEELGDIMWYVANLSAKLGLDLEGIAGLNLRRIAERWPAPGAEQPAGLLDDAYLPNEQIPRNATIEFREVDVGGRTKAQMYWQGMQIGNDLSDMNYDDDAYRFHDVFHLAFAALLGWSPVSRSFFAVKRESDPRVREIEDGGRAVVIEEGVSAFVFDYARQEAFLEGVNRLDSDLLRTIASLVSHLEVRVRTIAEWERAILRAYEIWREMRAHGGGVVEIDLPGRAIDYRSIE